MLRKAAKAIAIIVVVLIVGCVLAYHFSPDFKAGFDEGAQESTQK